MITIECNLTQSSRVTLITILLSLTYTASHDEINVCFYLHTAHVGLEITVLNIEWPANNMKPFSQIVKNAMFRIAFNVIEISLD